MTKQQRKDLVWEEYKKIINHALEEHEKKCNEINDEAEKVCKEWGRVLE